MQLIKRFADPQKKAVYVEKTTDKAAKLFGINSNALGYIVSDDDSEAKLCSLFKSDKGKKASPLIEVTGVDVSKEMLKVAKKKCQETNLKNVYLRCEDATNTKFAEESFDYVIIGLVLHESAPILRQAIISEAFRVLKRDGKLIVLEWEQQKSLIRKIMFLPLYITEAMGCLTFGKFYKCDKEKYFEQFHFKLKKKLVVILAQ